MNKSSGMSQQQATFTFNMPKGKNNKIRLDTVNLDMGAGNNGGTNQTCKIFGNYSQSIDSNLTILNTNNMFRFGGTSEHSTQNFEIEINAEDGEAKNFICDKNKINAAEVVNGAQILGIQQIYTDNSNGEFDGYKNSIYANVIAEQGNSSIENANQKVDGGITSTKCDNLDMKDTVVNLRLKNGILQQQPAVNDQIVPGGAANNETLHYL